MHYAELIGELFDLPPAPPARTLCTRENYREAVELRWARAALQDALMNWQLFEEHREKLAAWVEHYRRDCQFQVGEKRHNPTGTLTGMAWLMAHSVAEQTAGKGSLGPFIDFEEHFQRCFLRRGLLIYLTLLLKEREPEAETPNTEP